MSRINPPSTEEGIISLRRGAMVLRRVLARIMDAKSITIVIIKLHTLLSHKFIPVVIYNKPPLKWYALSDKGKY